MSLMPSYQQLLWQTEMPIEGRGVELSQQAQGTRKLVPQIVWILGNMGDQGTPVHLIMYFLCTEYENLWEHREKCKLQNIRAKGGNQAHNHHAVLNMLENTATTTCVVYISFSVHSICNNYDFNYYGCILIYHS